MWLHVDNHWLNMAQALVVDVDDTSATPTVSVVFTGNVKRTLTGVDRMDILEYLERASRAPYVLREARAPQVFGTTQAAIDYAIRSEGV